MFNLRKYQQDAILQATINQNGILVLPTGTGKSLVIAGICKQIQDPILILQPSKEILEQNFEKIKAFTDEDIGIYSASKGKREIHRITLATIGSIKDLEQFRQFKILLIDECFVEGTKIDDKNIEDIRIGDLVDSFNHELNIIEKKRVVAIRKIWHTENLCLTNSLNGSNISTLNHPFYTDRGYIEASNLNLNDSIYAKVYNLPISNKTNERISKIQIQKIWKNLLSKILRKNLCAPTLFGKDEKRKSHVQKRIQRKDEQNFKINGTQAKNSGRKWQGINRAAKNSFRISWRFLVSRVSYTNKRTFKEWLSLPLQNRFSQSIFKNCDRNRWEFSLIFNCKKKRCKERFFIKKVRLESIKIYQSSSNGRFGKGRYVYNLEVEDNNNYFANNILVHNCHLVDSKAGRYCEFIEEMGFKKIIGLTATPYRLKAWREGFSWQFLHRTRPKIFEKILYIYQIKQAFEEGFLCRISYFKYKYDLRQLAETNLDYREDSVVKYNQSINIYETIINIVNNNAARKHFLIFATTIDEAGYICELLLREGLSGYCISSKNTKKEREEILSEFKAGKVRFVVNVGVLTTGFDFPALDCIILARPTKSLALYYQMVGRGVRPFPKKENCEVYDLCGNWGTFGNLMTYEIEGDGAQTALKNSDGWLIKPFIKQAFKGGDWEVPFGKYKGTSIKEVPTEYLQYCLDNFENFFYKEQFEKALNLRNNSLTITI